MAESKKITKAVAKYRDRPNGLERCGRCTMFREPDRCTLVIGEVNPTGWCKHFDRKSQSPWYGEKNG